MVEEGLGAEMLSLQRHELFGPGSIHEIIKGQIRTGPKEQ